MAADTRALVLAGMNAVDYFFTVFLYIKYKFRNNY